MNWLYVESLEELKSLGKFREVCKKIKEDVGENIKVTGRSWADLYKNIVSLREIIEKISKDNKPHEKENKEEYFISKVDEYIFYLLELEGELRMQKLGINKSHFTNKKKAKQWRDKISKEIHPDKSDHEKSEEAMAKLNSIYEAMIGRG